MARIPAMEAIIPRFRNRSAGPLRNRRIMALSLPGDVHGQNIHTHGQNSGHGNAMKPKQEKYVVLLDRPLNAPTSTSEPTPALATLREHSVRRLQGLKSHPAEDSLSPRMRNHVLSRLKANV